MLFSEQNIDTFIELLTQQRSLFSPEQLDELNQLIEPLSDDVETLSDAISEWSEKYPEIEEAQSKLIDIKHSVLAPGSQEGNVPKPKRDLNKKTLKNAIQQSSVSEQPQSSES